PPGQTPRGTGRPPGRARRRAWRRRTPPGPRWGGAPGAGPRRWRPRPGHGRPPAAAAAAGSGSPGWSHHHPDPLRTRTAPIRPTTRVPSGCGQGRPSWRGGCPRADPGDMNDAPPGGSSATQGGHPGTDSFFDSLRRIDMRRTEDGWIGGGPAGLARRLAIDPLVVRAGFVLLGLFFGFGVLLYLLAWLLVPDTREQTHLERAMRQGDGTSIVLFVITVLVAVSSLPWWGGDGWWFGWWFGSLLLLALLVWGVWSLWERRSDSGATGSTTAAGMTGPPPPPPGAGGGPAAAAAPYAGATDPAAGFPAGPGTPPPGAGAPFATAPPTPPPPPPRPRRRPGGPMAGLLATGLALVTYGSLTSAADTYDWPGNTYVIAVAGTLAVLGLFVLVLGLAGRKGGFPGFLASLALVVTAVSAPLVVTLNVR